MSSSSKVPSNAARTTKCHLVEFEFEGQPEHHTKLGDVLMLNPSTTNLQLLEFVTVTADPRSSASMRLHSFTEAGSTMIYLYFVKKC